MGTLIDADNRFSKAHRSNSNTASTRSGSGSSSGVASGSIKLAGGHTSNSSLEVYDGEGRRRFHGAFTGGFSAGYYNTVREMRMDGEETGISRWRIRLMVF